MPLPPKSIAVLPFVNMSSSQENEYFCDGITEEIINALAQIKELKVTSRTSSFHFKGKNLPIQEIGEALNVSIILEGSIRLGGNQMRITAQLIDVAEDVHFFSETFDRSLADIFAVQDEVSLLIADRLREYLGHFEIEDRLVEAPKIPVEVYQKYLKGRYHLMKLDLESTQKAIKIYEEVIEAAPEFTLPYLDINQGLTYLGTMGQLPAMEAFAKAQPYLAKAIELDENHPRVQLNLAWIACWQHWDLKSAYRHLQKGIETRPSDEMYLTLSNLLTIEGKLDTAHAYADQALQIDPFAPMNVHYKGFLFFLQEQYEKAIPYCEKSLKLDPDLPFSRFVLGASLFMAGKPAESLAYFQQISPRPGDYSTLCGLCFAHHALGHTEETEVHLEQLREGLQTESMGTALHYLVMVLSQMGRLEEALDLLEQGLQARMPILLILPVDPLVKNLHPLPRFQELYHPIVGIGPDLQSANRKYKKSLLEPGELAKYKDQLEQLMGDQHLYLDPGLTLRDLAAQMSLPPNYLSQLLNEGFDQNFAEFVNSYRLEAFKEKALDPGQQHLTLLAIAYDSGFNSKTVFNTFFKKQMGTTPKAWWKQHFQQ